MSLVSAPIGCFLHVRTDLPVSWSSSWKGSARMRGLIMMTTNIWRSVSIIYCCVSSSSSCHRTDISNHSSFHHHLKVSTRSRWCSHLSVLLQRLRLFCFFIPRSKTNEREIFIVDFFTECTCVLISPSYLLFISSALTLFVLGGFL